MTTPNKYLPAYPDYWGAIVTPSRWGKNIPEDRKWIMDNDAFGGGFDPGKFFAYLLKIQNHWGRCIFVAVPDSVANAIETLHLFRHWAWQIKAMGLPVGFVAQDGQESLPFPPEYDALFIGGTTDWKLSDCAEYCIEVAKSQGKWVHVGRVNSQKRIKHFQLMGVDSVDGTALAFGADKNFKILNKQLAQMPLMKMKG